MGKIFNLFISPHYFCIFHATDKNGAMKKQLLYKMQPICSTLQLEMNIVSIIRDCPVIHDFIPWEMTCWCTLYMFIHVNMYCKEETGLPLWLLLVDDVSKQVYYISVHSIEFLGEKSSNIWIRYTSWWLPAAILKTNCPDPEWGSDLLWPIIPHPARKEVSLRCHNSVTCSTFVTLLFHLPSTKRGVT